MKYVSISGCVAAGKTTLLNRLLEHLGDRAQAHEERPQDNPFIRQYYADSARWSFHSQITFLALYFDNPDWLNPEREYYFFDRCFIENLVLARYRYEEGDLTDDEFAVIEKMANGVDRFMPDIDKYIYLRCSTDLLTQRLKERGREYESELGYAYAQKQRQLYEQWILTLPQDKLLIVDEDAGVDMDTILRFIEA